MNKQKQDKKQDKTKSVLVVEVVRTITSSKFGWLKLYYAELSQKEKKKIINKNDG